MDAKRVALRPRGLGALSFVLLLLGASGCDAAASGRGGTLGSTPATNTPADSAHVWGEIEDFGFIRHDGASLERSALLGRTSVVATLFTSCGGPCPAITSSLRELAQQDVASGVQFVALSVDPQRDTPEVLRDYAARHEVDPERVWFLTGERAEIHSWIQTNLKLSAGGDDGAGHTVSHDRRLTVIDAEGRVRGWYDHEQDRALLLERIDFLERERQGA